MDDVDESYNKSDYENYLELLKMPTSTKFITIHFKTGVPSHEFDVVGKQIASHFNITDDYHFCCIADNVALGFMIDNKCYKNLNKL